MHCLLNIPELLNSILDHADQNTRVAATRVSRSFSDPALDTIWRELESIVPLLEILGPMSLDGGPYERWTFAGPCFPEQWERVKVVAKRVRSLVHDDERPIKNQMAPLDPSVFFDLALQSPWSCLLPNLRSLSWRVASPNTPSHILLFIPPGIQDLTLEFTDSLDPRSIIHFLRLVRQRTKSPTHFRIRTRFQARSIHEEVAACIREWDNLVTVELPHFYHTADIVDALGSRKRLRALDTQLISPIYDGSLSHLKFDVGRFSLLEELSFDATLEDATALLQNPHRPPKLTDICLSTYLQTLDQNQMQIFFETLAQSYPEIKSLAFNFFQSRELPIHAIAFSTIRPLLNCRKIRTFVMGHNYPLAMDEADVEELTKSWPELQELGLCEDPVIPVDSDGAARGLPLSCLSSFANNTPNLTHLSLYLDTTLVPHTLLPHPLTGPPGPNQQYTQQRFANLTIFDMGTSQVARGTDMHEAAIFMSELFPPTTSLQCGPGAWHRFSLGLTAGEIEMLAESQRRWGEMSSLVETFRRYRARYQRQVTETVMRELGMQLTAAKIGK